jgi:hypothetical protein
MSFPNPSGESAAAATAAVGEDPREGGGAGDPLREGVALVVSPVPSDSAANGRGLPIIGICVADSGHESESESDDVQKVPCPKCGAESSLLDPQIDGYLREGYIFDCYACGARIRVAAVDYDIHVYCRVAP